MGSASNTHIPDIICGYEPLSGPYICILPNNHEAVGQTEHMYMTIREYYDLNLQFRGL